MKKPGTKLFLCLLFLPVILYLLMVHQLAVNIPREDDYDVILGYLNSSGEDRFQLLFAQHNEHRPIFTKAVSEITYQLLGQVDFRILVFIGNASLVALFYVLYLLFNKTGVPVIYFLPVPYLLFSIRLWGNATWAMASLGNYYVLLFALLSLFFFTKKGGASFAFSMIFAVASASSSGSGLLVFPVLLVWAVTKVMKRKSSDGQVAPASSKQSNDVARLTATLAISCLVLCLYFHNYTKPDHHPSLLDSFFQPFQSITYFFAFLGSCIPYKLPGVLIGMTSFSLFCYLTYNKHYAKDPVLYYFSLLLIVNAAAGAVTRSGMGINQALSSRYAIISVLLLTSIYLLFAGRENFTSWLNPKFQKICFLLLFAVSMYLFTVHLDILTKKRQKLVEGAEQWKATGNGLAYPNQKHATTRIHKAIKKGYYQLPPSPGD